MRIIVSALVFISTSAALVAPAFADSTATRSACARPAAAKPTRARRATTKPACAEPAAAKPAFALMDNTGDGSKVNLDLAVLAPTIRDLRGVVAARPSITGQYVASNGFGGYLGIGMSRLMSRKEPNTGGVELRRNFGLGSPEVGGLFHRALSPNFDLGVRVGFVHPTGVKDEDALLHGLTTLLARPSDMATALPDTFWLRLGISPTYHHGPLFVRADLGADIAVDKTAAAGGGGGENEALGEIRKGDTIEHINVGVGIQRNRFIATAEMQAAFMKYEGEIITSSTAGISARYQGKMLSPFVLVSTPLVLASTPFGIVLADKVVNVTGGLTLWF